MEASNLVKQIINRLKIQGYCQVEGHNKFVYIRETDKSVILLREKGTETRVPYSKMAQVLEAGTKFLISFRSLLLLHYIILEFTDRLARRQLALVLAESVIRRTKLSHCLFL